MRPSLAILALGDADRPAQGLFLVAPDSRQDDVRAPSARPAFSPVADLHVRFLPYGELEKHREAIAWFGAGLKAIDAIARSVRGGRGRWRVRRTPARARLFPALIANHRDEQDDHQHANHVVRGVPAIGISLVSM